MNRLKQLWRWLMSLYIGDANYSQNKILHIANGSNDIGLDSGRPYDKTCFHSDMEYISLAFKIRFIKSSTFGSPSNWPYPSVGVHRSYKYSYQNSIFYNGYDISDFSNIDKTNGEYGQGQFVRPGLHIDGIVRASYGSNFYSPSRTVTVIPDDIGTGVFTYEPFFGNPSLKTSSAGSGFTTFIDMSNLANSTLLVSKYYNNNNARHDFDYIDVFMFSTYIDKSFNHIFDKLSIHAVNNEVLIEDSQISVRGINLASIVLPSIMDKDDVSVNTVDDVLYFPVSSQNAISMYTSSGYTATLGSSSYVQKMQLCGISSAGAGTVLHSDNNETYISVGSRKIVSSINNNYSSPRLVNSFTTLARSAANGTILLYTFTLPSYYVYGQSTIMVLYTLIIPNRFAPQGAQPNIPIFHTFALSRELNTSIGLTFYNNGTLFYYFVNDGATVKIYLQASAAINLASDKFDLYVAN